MEIGNTTLIGANIKEEKGEQYKLKQIDSPSMFFEEKPAAINIEATKKMLDEVSSIFFGETPMDTSEVKKEDKGDTLNGMKVLKG
jgi:hypothetical protein